MLKKLYKIAAGTVAAVAVLAALGSAPVSAVQPRTGADSVTATSDVNNPVAINTIAEVGPTFSEEILNDDQVLLRFGKNALLAGNRTNSKLDVDGILVSLGNSLDISTISDYAVVAGNMVNYAGTTRSDLFIAGNVVKIEKGADVGRDIYAVGNQVNLESNVYGDFSVASASVSLGDVVVTGNVNISADEINFSGEVRIDGTLTYNDTAIVSGLNNVKAQKTSTYTPEEKVSKEQSAADAWLELLMSIVGLFCAMILVIIVFPSVKNGAAEAASVNAFGKNLLIGLGVFALTPVACLLLLITIVAAPAAIIALVVYLIMLYLAKGFAGAWLGYLIVEKLLKGQLPAIVETLIGIILIGLVSMIPGIGMLVTLVAILFGMGLMVTTIRRGNAPKTEQISEKAEKKIAKKSAAKKSAKK